MRSVTITLQVADPSDIFAYADPEGFFSAIKDPLARTGLGRLFCALQKSGAMLTDNATPVNSARRAVEYVLQQIAIS